MLQFVRWSMVMWVRFGSEVPGHPFGIGLSNHFRYFNNSCHLRTVRHRLVQGGIVRHMYLLPMRSRSV